MAASALINIYIDPMFFVRSAAVSYFDFYTFLDASQLKLKRLDTVIRGVKIVLTHEVLTLILLAIQFMVMEKTVVLKKQYNCDNVT
jgi:hypothetical protein